MNPFAAIAVKSIGAAGVAALLSVGAMSVSAASPTPKPTPSAAAGAQKPSADSRADRRAIRRAVIEAEADVLGIKPETLLKDLKSGQKVSDLAKDKGMTKEQFETKLVANLRPRLEALVDHKTITQAQADKVIDRINKGYVPFWDGVHRKK
jgi:membrane-bound lytic murein transglycosylase B